MSTERIPAALIDIDGVLCDVGYTPPSDGFKWDEFIVADLDRTAIEEGIMVVHSFIRMGLFPVFLTARPERMRAQTEKMLVQYGFGGNAKLIMARDSVTVDSDYEYQLNQMREKERCLVVHSLTTQYSFLYAIDDQQYNIDMFRRYGIPTLMATFR